MLSGRKVKKYTLVLLAMFVIVFPAISLAQVWVARYNGPDNDREIATAIAVDSTGNVYVTGESWGSGTALDYATVKYDSAGIEQWVARYDGRVSGDDWGRAIAVDNAGNVYVTGHSMGQNDYYDYATVKYNAAGVERWVQWYDGPGNADDKAEAIAVDNAGNSYVTGLSWDSDSSYDFATVKYDSSGVEQWVARYNGPGNYIDWARAIFLDNACNIYVTGGSDGSGTSRDYATVKYDSSGVEQWVARYDGPVHNGDDAQAIAVDNAGNVYVTGWSWGTVAGYDYATVKYDSSGVEQWVARYNGPNNNHDMAYAIAVDNTRSAVYVTGYVIAYLTSIDYATIKYDSSGVEQWVERYNGSGSGNDEPSAIAVDNAGNAYVTGGSVGSSGDWDYATLKYDASGMEQWVMRYNGPDNDADWATAIALDNEGFVYVTGGSWGSGTDYDYATIKYPCALINVEETPSEKPRMRIDVYPNPFRKLTNISFGMAHSAERVELKIYDATGRIVKDLSCTMPNALSPTQTSWDGTDSFNRKLPSGVYFLEFQAGYYTDTRKIILLR